jgi:hypothetical protein
VLDTKIYFTRLLENRSGSLFRLLSPEETLLHIRTASLANKMEENLRERGTTDSPSSEDDTWHDDSDLSELDNTKCWQWHMDFKGLEEFVQEHGQRGGGMTDGWCVSRGWGSVTGLKAAFQVVDGGAGGVHGGEEIVLE